ncbi:nucleotidyltransferase domain-containing protein [Candidatus Poriferisodalis sp.]|uniref:nucleotidyltransferase domain-containing protein n=1 Tax=Candidatus Poriferisodalis sp. TaxID=3101277 RepID=UPI003B020F74
MALREDARIVPTLEHARTAADVLAEEGASLVLVHGSVSEGRARPGSDVDLVAVFDDIDYDERYPRRWRLEAKCLAAAGVPVEVHVTDWPEWEHRTSKVKSSFEAAINRRRMTLFEREPTAVDWGKELGMPDSDLSEAVDRLTGVAQALREMADSCRPSAGELVVVDGTEEIDESVRHSRLRSLCADASMVIENSIKALSAVNEIVSERRHKIAELIEAAGPMPDDLVAALEPLRANTMRPSLEDWDDISSWRIGGTYPSSMPQATKERTERLAQMLTSAAVTAAEATLNRVLDAGASPDDERMVTCQRRLSTAQTVMSAGDVVTGVAAALPGGEQTALQGGRLRR